MLLRKFLKALRGLQIIYCLQTFRNPPIATKNFRPRLFRNFFIGEIIRRVGGHSGSFYQKKPPNWTASKFFGSSDRIRTGDLRLERERIAVSFSNNLLRFHQIKAAYFLYFKTYYNSVKHYVLGLFLTVFLTHS